MKKTVAVALVLVLCLSLVPVAHADAVDALFDLLISERNTGDAQKSYSYSRVGDLVIFIYSTKSAEDAKALFEFGQKQTWETYKTALLFDANKIEAHLAEASESAKLIYTLTDTEGNLMLVLSQGEVLFDALTGVNLFAGMTVS